MMIRIGLRLGSGLRPRFRLGCRSRSDPDGAGSMIVPAPWERGPSEVKSERRGVCDGTNAGAMRERVAGVESRRYEVCDSTDIMGVGAMGGRVRSSFKKKLFRKKIFLDKKYLKNL